jgi:hypothetical protein
VPVTSLLSIFDQRLVSKTTYYRKNRLGPKKFPTDEDAKPSRKQRRRDRNAGGRENRLYNPKSIGVGGCFFANYNT